MGAGMSKKVQVRVQTCKKGGGTELILDDCDIYDKMPEKLTSLSSLTKLDISHNHLTLLATNIGKLSKLEFFDFSYNEIEELPASITKLTKLKILDCSTNMITQLPSKIENFGELETLNISGNAIKQLPPSITTLTKIRRLDFASSRLETVDNTLFNITCLREVILAYNALATIPEAITQLTYLEVLDFTDNKLKEIPSFINKLAALKVLIVEGNQINELPDEIGGLIHLEILNVGRNNIKSISNIDFSQMHEMLVLVFHNNQLTEFTEGVGQMKKIRDINLEDNLLKKIPREVGWVGKSLRSLLLARNKLVRLPGEIAFLNPTVKLSLDGNPLVDPFNMLLNNMKTLTQLKPYCLTYLKAFPSNCIAQGDAVLESQAGIGTRFFIEARDYEGNIRVNGKDKFLVKFVHENAAADAPDEQSNFAIVKDLEDGTYQVAFNNRLAGTYRLHITNENVHIRNSPFTHRVLPGLTNPANCRVVGPGFSADSPPPQSGMINNFLIQAMDQFGNQQIIGGEPFSVTILGGNNPVPLTEDLNNGSYRIQWTPAWAGNYEVQIGYSGYHVAGSPFQINVPQ